MQALLNYLSEIELTEEMEEFALHYEDVLRQYLPLENGLPSYDTMQRVMGLISPDITGNLSKIWADLVSQEEEDKLRKLLAIDGKTMRGNASISKKHWKGPEGRLRPGDIIKVQMFLG